MNYDFITTANGVLEKKDNSNPEFVVPDALDDLIRSRDFGPYADESGELVVCFIHGTDITGGNSGSPVLDANGDLIGCAFDGNWEAMSGDIAFETELQRTISVDIRYVTWILDKFCRMRSNLIDEMDLVSAADAKQTRESEMKAAPPERVRVSFIALTRIRHCVAAGVDDAEHGAERSSGCSTSASHFEDFIAVAANWPRAKCWIITSSGRMMSSRERDALA